MNRRLADLAAGLAVLGFASMFLVQSEELDGMSLIFPRGLIVFLICGGVYLLIKSFRNRASHTDPEPTNLSRVITIAASSVLYVPLIIFLGFYPATAVFLFATATILADSGGNWRRRIMTSALFSGVMCVSIWLVFAKLLTVPTPAGIFL